MQTNDSDTSRQQLPPASLDSAAAEELVAGDASAPGDSPPGESPPGELNDGYPLDEQPTVISSGPPLLLPKVAEDLQPQNLGRRLEGERLGHFQLETFIGGGGMGAVFRAMDTMLNRVVAVKVLTNEQASDEETRRRFKNEAQSAARLDHENIARVYYVGEDRGVHYIVFEHIEGVNVRDLVAGRGPLPLAEAVSYTLQVAKALDHASRRDVVHRDIKPSNILVTEQGRAKLVDMGLARLHQVEHADNDLTASGVTLGTFDYISPEQARDPRRADVRSDLYSLGCTLFFMLTGRPPFPEGTVLQKLLKHQADRPTDPRELRSDLPVEISWISKRLLAKSPEDRFRSPRELIHALVGLCDRAGLDVPDAEPLRGVFDDSGRRRTFRNKRFSRVLRSMPAVVVFGMLFAVVALDMFFLPSGEPWLRAESEREVVVAPGDSSESTPERTGEDGSPATVDSGTEEGSQGEGSASTSPAAKESGAGASAAEEKGEASSSFPDDDSLLEQRVADTAGGAGAGQQVVRAGVSLVGDMTAGISATQHASGGAASSAEESQPKPSPEIKPTTRIVNPSNPQAYPSLIAALRDAESGDAIEIHTDQVLVDGRIDVKKRKITIRGAAGLFPRIVFRPGPDEKSDVLYSRSMISVGGGSLAMFDVELELDLTSAAGISNRWMLIEAQGESRLEFTGCVLTVRNGAPESVAYRDGVAMIEVTSPPDSGRMTMSMHDEPEVEEPSPAQVELTDCIVRGESVFLRNSDMQSVELSWKNGLAAVSQRLLVHRSAQVPNRRSAKLAVELRHVTAAVPQGFLLVSSRDAYAMQADVKLQDSILIAGADAALVEHRGVQPVAELKETLSWQAERTLYEGVNTFWRLDVEDDLAPPESMDAQRWFDYWNARNEASHLHTHTDVAIWRELPPRDRPAHAFIPRDYALSLETAGNEAIGAATDGRNVGLLVEDLPVPHNSLAESPADASDAGDGSD